MTTIDALKGETPHTARSSVTTRRMVTVFAAFWIAACVLTVLDDYAFLKAIELGVYGYLDRLLPTWLSKDLPNPITILYTYLPQCAVLLPLGVAFVGARRNGAVYLLLLVVMCAVASTIVGDAPWCDVHLAAAKRQWEEVGAVALLSVMMLATPLAAYLATLRITLLFAAPLPHGIRPALLRDFVRWLLEYGEHLAKQFASRSGLGLMVRAAVAALLVVGASSFVGDWWTSVVRQIVDARMAWAMRSLEEGAIVDPGMVLGDSYSRCRTFAALILIIPPFVWRSQRRVLSNMLRIATAIIAVGVLGDVRSLASAQLEALGLGWFYAYNTLNLTFAGAVLLGVIVAAVCRAGVALTPPYGFAQWIRRARPGSCHHCGYDLTGNTSQRCPECGTMLGATSMET